MQARRLAAKEGSARKQAGTNAKASMLLHAHGSDLSCSLHEVDSFYLPCTLLVLAAYSCSRKAWGLGIQQVGTSSSLQNPKCSGLCLSAQDAIAEQLAAVEAARQQAAESEKDAVANRAEQLADQRQPADSVEEEPGSDLQESVKPVKSDVKEPAPPAAEAASAGADSTSAPAAGMSKHHRCSLDCLQRHTRCIACAEPYKNLYDLNGLRYWSILCC